MPVKKVIEFEIGKVIRIRFPNDFIFINIRFYDDIRPRPEWMVTLNG